MLKLRCRIKAKMLDLALASYTRPLFEALYYSHVEPYLLSWEETLSYFAGFTVSSSPTLHVGLVSYL